MGPAIVPVPLPAADREFSALPDAGPPPPAGTPFFESPALPGYRVAVRITAGASQPPVRREVACIAETLCISGAVKATGVRQYYLLPAASADSDDLTGLFDREGFVP